MIVLDTDVLIEIFDRGSGKGEKAMRNVEEAEEGVSITSVNLHEILYGLKKYDKPREKVLWLPVLSYTKRDAKLASSLELRAEEKGKATSRTDAMIAAMPINNGAELYTFDLDTLSP